jgi:hypothetical protein
MNMQVRCEAAFSFVPLGEEFLVPYLFVDGVSLTNEKAGDSQVFERIGLQLGRNGLEDVQEFQLDHMVAWFTEPHNEFVIQSQGHGPQRFFGLEGEGAPIFLRPQAWHIGEAIQVCSSGRLQNGAIPVAGTLTYDGTRAGLKRPCKLWWRARLRRLRLLERRSRA